MSGSALRAACAWAAFAAVVAITGSFVAGNAVSEASSIRKGTVRKGSIQIEEPGAITDLRGDWSFYRGQFVATADSAIPDGFSSLPGSWRDAGMVESRGYASYGLRVFGLVPGTRYAIRVGQTFSACSVAVGGKVVAASGSPGRTVWEERPGWAPVIARFYSRDDGSAEIVLRVSNFHDATGGTNAPICIGPSTAVNRLDERRRASEAFAVSLLLVSGLLFLLQFFLSPGSRQFLWFSLALLAAGARALCYDCLILADAFPRLSWYVYYRIANLTFPLLVAFGIAIVARLYERELANVRFWPLASPFVALSALILFLPARVSSLILPPARIAACVAIPLLFAALLSTGVWRLPRGKAVCCAYFAATVSFMHDLLVSLWVLDGFRVGSVGAAAFLLIIALVETHAYASSFDTVRELTARLQDINRALSKFAPREIVDLLGNDSPADMKMAIMHVCALSGSDADGHEDHSALFSFLNECFSLISPLIRAEGGFIARYTADGALALFPRGSEAALRCAIKLQSAVAAHNRAHPGASRLCVAIGIDSGNVAPEAIVSGYLRRAGSFERAARQFHSKILISAASLSELPDPLAWFIRPVDRPNIDGSREFLFEVYNNDPDVVRELKLQTQDDLERMLYSAFSGRKDEAWLFFEKARAVFPDDPVLRSFAREMQ